MRIKAAKDLWINIIFIPVLAVMSASLLMIPWEYAFLYCLLLLPVAGFLLWLYFGTYYEFRENYLLCKSGPFTERIAYDRIKSAVLSNNLMSSLALSRQRIEIRQHGKGYLAGTTMISPVNREEFLQELLSRCHNIESK